MERETDVAMSFVQGKESLTPLRFLSKVERAKLGVILVVIFQSDYLKTSTIIINNDLTVLTS